MDHERRRYLFSGRVQGVGFRQTTRRIARAYPVTGYVRNLADGRVEVVVGGRPGDVSAFLGAVRREFAGHIEGIEQGADPGAGPPGEGFEIRF